MPKNTNEIIRFKSTGDSSNRAAVGIPHPSRTNAIFISSARLSRSFPSPVRIDPLPLTPVLAFPDRVPIALCYWKPSCRVPSWRAFFNKPVTAPPALSLGSKQIRPATFTPAKSQLYFVPNRVTAAEPTSQILLPFLSRRIPRAPGTSFSTGCRSVS